MQSCMNKPRSTMVFTNLPYQSSPSFSAFFVPFCFEVRRTVEFAGKLRSRKQRDRCWVLGSAQPTFKLVAMKEIKVMQACSILEVHRCYAHVR